MDLNEKKELDLLGKNQLDLIQIFSTDNNLLLDRKIEDKSIK